MAPKQYDLSPDAGCQLFAGQKNMTQKEFSCEWGGRKLALSTGLLAKQATASVEARIGDTVVLATVVIGGIRAGIDYFPLMVDFEERLYAAGKIKSSRFIKREGKPSDEAILTGRLIDRSIRPLFPWELKNEVQVTVTCLCYDEENDPAVLGLIAASAALHISRIPWAGPIAASRISRADGKLILNASVVNRDAGDMDVVVAGTKDKLIMLEAGAKEITEADAVASVKFGLDANAAVVELIEKMRKEVGAAKADVNDLNNETAEAVAAKKESYEATRAFLLPKIEELFFSVPKANKVERAEAKKKLHELLEADLEAKTADEDSRLIAHSQVEEVVEEAVTNAILDKNRRVDGRKIDEIRTLASTVGVLPRTHGSGLFERGDTQVLSVVTLGGPGDAQILDGMEQADLKKRYMHHYNFPGYAVGEAKSNRGPGRREIGHGALAERALEPVLPTVDKFPYVIRVVSEVLGSNGSSSMGSACGSTLALMDAGVPLTAPVAGVAMGIATKPGSDEYKIITDLQDLEDGVGGMDFKICGTRKGITAIQMDTKTSGLSMKIVEETFAKARDGRMKILDVMEACIAQPRAELSKFAPRIETIMINPEKIRDVIGPGGKMINQIIAETGATIDVEDDGRVTVTCNKPEGMTKAVEWIKSLTKEVVVGEIYHGKVVRIMDFGAFVELTPNQDGMVHISQLAPWRVNRIEDVVNIGDEVPVKVIEIDEMGRVNLSVKAAREQLNEPQFPMPEGYESMPPAPRAPRPSFGGRGGGGRGPSRGGHGGRR
jgi:polyribonucleotide nucleotidyltransferase